MKIHIYVDRITNNIKSVAVISALRINGQDMLIRADGKPNSSGTLANLVDTHNVYDLHPDSKEYRFLKEIHTLNLHDRIPDNVKYINNQFLINPLAQDLITIHSRV